MPVAKTINTDTYLDISEIEKNLQNVDYIILATPAPRHFKDTPIQFTIFLNTQENFPQDIKDAILDKFLDEQEIFNPIEVMSQIMPVGFGLSTQQDTLMPLLLVKSEDVKNIPNKPMHVIDFLADSEKFNEVKNDGLTGWSYSYN